jgi:hypothetical protein
MPLYTYNGQLLIVNGALAANANCCCDLTCDALLITYDWVASGQPDLDTGTTFLGNKVGWSCSTCNDDPPYMEWSCDNTNVSAIETVKIFFRDALLANQWSGSTTVQLAAGWCRPAGGSNPTPLPGYNPRVTGITIASGYGRVAFSSSGSWPTGPSTAPAVYTSINAGTTSTSRQPSAVGLGEPGIAGTVGWRAIAGSATGLKLLATVGVVDEARLTILTQVHESLDGGATWQYKSTLPVGVFTQPGHQMLASSDASKVVIVGTRVVISNDGGATWAINGVSPGSVGRIAMSANGETIVALLTHLNGRFSVSADGGATWTTRTGNITTGNGLNLVPFNDPKKYVAVTPSGNLIYITTGERIYRSSDQGLTWTRATSFSSNGNTFTEGYLNNGYNPPIQVFDNYNFWLSHVVATEELVVVHGWAVDAAKLPEGVAVDRGNVVYVSSDQGATYTARLNGNWIDGTVGNLTINNDGDLIFFCAGTNNDIWRGTSYGLTWDRIYLVPLPVVVRVRCLTGGPEQVKTILPGVQDNCTTTNVGYITINEDGTFTLN